MIKSKRNVKQNLPQMEIGFIFAARDNLLIISMAPSKKYFKVEDYIADLPQWMQEQLFVVREIILQSNPDIKESMKFNIPFYTLNGLLFYFSLYKKKEFVLGICNGAKLQNKHQKLRADAKQKYIRHWVLLESSEPDYELLAEYIEEAINLNLTQRTFTQSKKK
jgi:hypothetical protein